MNWLRKLSPQSWLGITDVHDDIKVLRAQLAELRELVGLQPDIIPTRDHEGRDPHGL